MQASGCLTFKFLVYSTSLNSQPHPGKIQIPPPLPARNNRQTPVSFQGGGILELQVNQ